MSFQRNFKENTLFHTLHTLPGFMRPHYGIVIHASDLTKLAGRDCYRNRAFENEYVMLDGKVEEENIDVAFHTFDKLLGHTVPHFGALSKYWQLSLKGENGEPDYPLNSDFCDYISSLTADLKHSTHGLSY